MLRREPCGNCDCSFYSRWSRSGACAACFDLLYDGDLCSLGDGDAESFAFSFAASNSNFAAIMNFFADQGVEEI